MNKFIEKLKRKPKKIVEKYTAKELREIAIKHLGAHVVASMTDDDLIEWYNLGV